MKYLLVCSLFLLSLPSLVAQNACIQGRVVDTNGTPIGGVHITGTISTKRISFDISSETDGSLQMDGIPPGKYVIATRDEPNNAEPDTIIATENECGTVTLHRPVRAKIHLSAKNLLTGENISDLTSASRPFNGSEWTSLVSEQGSVMVPPNTGLQFRVGAPGFEVSTVDASSLQPGEQKEISLLLRPTATGCIRGKVVDAQGNLIAGAEVMPELQDALLDYAVRRRKTDRNGEFQFEHLQPGNYSVGADVSFKEYPVVSTNNSFVVLSVQPGAGCSEATINIGPKAAQLKFAVIDAQTQQRLKSFTGSVTGDTWNMKVIANPLPVPPLERVNISVSAEGYRTAKTEIGPLQPEETREVRVELIAK